MQILLGSSTYAPSCNGQAVFTTSLAEGLAGRGHSVMVVTQSERRSPYHVERNGVQVFAISALSLGLWYPGATISIMQGAAVRRAFKQFRPEFVHVQDHYPISWHVVRAARQDGLKVIGTNHFMPENLAPYFQSMAWFKPGYNWVLWRWMLSLYNRFDLVTGPSATAVDILRSQGLRVPAYPISCGVDLERFHPLPEVDRAQARQKYRLDPASTLFLYVGRVDGEKQIDTLLHAMHRLERQDVQLVIAGKGAALKDLRRLANSLGLGERVRFLGYIPSGDLPALLNSADVFCMPSNAELLSIATLEAMACGKPILAARSQALPELVAHGQNGYLFNPLDPDHAATWMNVLAEERWRWPAMQAASLARVQAHSLPTVIKRYEDLYEQALALPAGRSPLRLGSSLERLVKKYTE